MVLLSHDFHGLLSPSASFASAQMPRLLPSLVAGALELGRPAQGGWAGGWGVRALDAPDPVSLRGGKGRIGPSCFAELSLVALRRLGVFVLEEGGAAGCAL